MHHGSNAAVPKNQSALGGLLSAVARAAKNLRVPQIVSTVSSKTIEDIASAHGDHPHWFQLYWGRNNDFTRSIIGRAEKAGYSHIVVPLDTRLFAWR